MVLTAPRAVRTSIAVSVYFGLSFPFLFLFFLCDFAKDSVFILSSFRFLLDYSHAATRCVRRRKTALTLRCLSQFSFDYPRRWKALFISFFFLTNSDRAYYSSLQKA